MVRRATWVKATCFSALLGAGCLVAGGWAMRSGRFGIRRALAEPRATAPQADLPEPAAPAAGGTLELPAVVECPEDVRRVVRAAALAGPEDASRLRRAAIGSGDTIVAANAIRALGRVGAAAGDAEVVQLLDDPRPRVRQETVAALGANGEQRSLQDLIPVLHDQDPTLRALAIRSIGQIGGPRAREVLEVASADRERTEVERVFLREALAQPR